VNRTLVTGIAVAVLLLVFPAASRAGSTVPAASASTDAGFGSKVRVRLQLVPQAPASVERVSFGIPLPPGAVTDASVMRVLQAGGAAAVGGVWIQPTLYTYDAAGAVTGIRAVLVSLPRNQITGKFLDVDVYWQSGVGGPQTHAAVPFSAQESWQTAKMNDRSIAFANGVYTLVDGPTKTRQLYKGFEPVVTASFPDGYLAYTGILGPQISRTQLLANPALAGVAFVSNELMTFGDGAVYDEGYGVNANYLRHTVLDADASNPAVYLNDDSEGAKPYNAFEGWLYDRCATFLTAYAHADTVELGRRAMRTCSFYAGRINADGYFIGKPPIDPYTGNPVAPGSPGSYYDDKYSHVRGLYAYYALTGDPQARTAIRNIAKLWRDEQDFVAPYRDGHLRGVDKQWTERLLGTSLEGLIYGYLATGDKSYLAAFKQMFATGYRHISTANQATLDKIDLSHFPPQNCFIHNSAQHGDGAYSTTEPWCSGWMTELVIDPLLRYQELTGDPHVDEIFIRLARQLRDVGTEYFSGDVLGDSFLKPSRCFDRTNKEDPRILTPIYGSGLKIGGQRVNNGEFDDFEHCPDATALLAVALRALKNTGGADNPGVGPFATEGASFLALHNEFAFCARYTFDYHVRTNRDPRLLSQDELAAGYSGGNLKAQTAWLADNKIGYPVHETAPLRKFSWWFNTSMLQYALLTQAGADVSKVSGGHVNPAGCK